MDFEPLTPREEAIRKEVPFEKIVGGGENIQYPTLKSNVHVQKYPGCAEKESMFLLARDLSSDVQLDIPCWTLDIENPRAKIPFRIASGS